VFRASSGKYGVRYRDPAGRQREKKTFTRKRDAEVFANQVEADKARGLYLDPTLGKTTVAEYAEQWLVAQLHKPSTEDSYRRNLKNHILPTFGSRALGSIRPTEVQAWVRKLGEQLAPSTVKLVYGVFATIMKAAVRDGRLAKTPCLSIRLPLVPRTSVRVLTPDEVVSLAEAVPARYEALIILAAGTGLRQGESFGLTEDRIGWLLREVRVDRQLVLVTGTGQGPQFSTPKTAASNRTVPLAQFVIEALSVHVAQFPPTEEGLLFSTPKGAPLRRGSFNSDVLKPALKRAGLPEGISFHDLRHTFASTVIAGGASPKEVQAWMGHASITETFDTYGHLFPQSADRARTAVDDAFARARADLLLTSAGPDL
jgi:integrase